MIRDTLQNFLVEDKFKMEHDGATVGGFNKNKSKVFGLVILNEDGSIASDDDFIVTGYKETGNIQLEEIIVDATSSQVRVTMILPTFTSQFTIVPKEGKRLSVDMFYISPTYVTENSFKVRGGN